MKKIKKSGLIFVVSGPSGSGKTTLVSEVFRDKVLKGKLSKSVSFTTRPKRLTEQNGKDYFFITNQEFRRYLGKKKILEWTRYLGYYYATPRDFVDKELKDGKSIILCLDLIGAKRLKRLYPDEAVTIFVKPPSMSKLKERIEGRGKKSGESGILKRLSLAKKELLAARKYDYNIVNNDLQKAASGLKKIIRSQIQSRVG